MGAPDSVSVGRGRSWAPIITLGVCAVVHVLLVLYFVRNSGPEPKAPNVFAGWGIEAYRVARCRLAHALTGALWTYDPMTLSGQRVGVVEPLGTRLFVHASFALSAYVGGPVRALWVTVLIASFLFPLLGYAAAAHLGLTRAGRTLAFGLFSMLWFFDSLIHGAWATGRLPWVLGSAFVVLALAATHATLRAPSRRAAAVALGAGLAAGAVHPVSGIVSATCCLFMALTRASVSPLQRMGAIVASLAPVGFILATRVVVHGALTNEPLGVGWTASPVSLVLDLLEIPAAGPHGPGPVRTLFRSGVVVAGLLGAIRLHRSGDSRRVAILPLAASGLLTAYAGSLVKVTWPLDPPLFAIPAVLVLVGPACDVLLAIPWRELTFRRGLAGKVALAAALALGVPRLVRTVGTYVPELLPVAVVRAPGDASKSSLIGLFEPMPDALPYAPAPPALLDLAGFLTATVREGRVLALDASVAALLTVRSPLDVLGPIAERGAPSADADPTSLLSPRATWDAARGYLEHYAVTWVVLPLTPSVFDGEHPELGPVLPAFGYRVRKVLHPTGLVLEGDATVKDRHPGIIHVEVAARERVTLRMHYDERLGCRPGCRVERREVDFDRAGFITVSDPPSDLEIFLR